jgi:hypothetical protein
MTGSNCAERPDNVANFVEAFQAVLDLFRALAHD